MECTIMGVKIKIKPLKSEGGVNWLIHRVEKRLHVTFSKALRQELHNEFQQEFIKEMTLNSFVEPQWNLSNEERLRRRVYQEAMLMYSALPPANGEGNIPLDISLDQTALKKMRKARGKFERRIEDFLDLTKLYWEEEIPHYQGETHDFNQAQFLGVPQTSLIIVSLADRFDNLMRRLHEIEMRVSGGQYELIITIADPERLSSALFNQLKQTLEVANFPSKVVFSLKNTIAINRNLAVSQSRGNVFIIMDDDNKLVGPVIRQLCNALTEYPELGLISVPTCDHTLSIQKPGAFNLKVPLFNNIYVKNRWSGMILATRRNLARAIPFTGFWPNFGEDEQFSRSIHGIGYLSAYIYSDDAYLVNEPVAIRATKNPNTFRDVLINEALSAYLEPLEDNEVHDNLAIMRLRVFGGSCGSSDDINTFWKVYKESFKQFLNDREHSLRQLASGRRQNAWLKGRERSLEGVIGYLEENRERITTYKTNEYEKRKLSDVNVFLGPLTYTKKEKQSDSVSIQFMQDEREERSNDFNITVPTNASREYKDRVATNVVCRIHNAMINNAGPNVTVEVPKGWKVAFQQALKKFFGGSRSKRYLEEYYSNISIDIIVKTGQSENKQFEVKSLVNLEPSILAISKEGIYLGADFGGSAVKLAAFVDGENISLGAIEQCQSKFRTADEFIGQIESAVDAAESRLRERESGREISGIGISWNSPVRGSQVVLGRNLRSQLGIEEAKKIAYLPAKINDMIRERFGQNVAVTFKNDGYAGAVQAASRLNSVNIAYIGLGSSLAFGFINKDGRHAMGFNEVFDLRIDMSDHARGSHRQTPGAWEYYIALKGMIGLAQEQGLLPKDIPFESFAREADSLICRANAGEKEILNIACKMGKYLAEGVIELTNYRPLERVLVGGGLVMGSFGESLMASAQKIINDRHYRIELSRYEGDPRYVSAMGIARLASCMTCESDENPTASTIRINAHADTFMLAQARVQRKLKSAVNQLDGVIKAINQRAGIVEIKVQPSSYTKGLMIVGSDFDNLVVYVQEIGEDKLRHLNNLFIEFLTMDGLRLFDEYENPPLLLAVENLQEEELKYGLDDVPLVSIYRNGRFRSRRDIVKDSNKAVPKLFDKHIARIKLFYLSGQIDQGWVRALLSHQEDEYYYQELMDMINESDGYRLSSEALRFVSILDNLIQDDKWEYTVPEGNERGVECVIIELYERGLVKFYNGKLVVTWRTMGARWSESIWNRWKFTLYRSDPENTGGSIDLTMLIGERIKAGGPLIHDDALIGAMYSTNPNLSERALRSSMHSKKVPSEISKAYIENLGFKSIFVNTAAIQALQLRVITLEEPLKDYLLKLVTTGSIGDYFSSTRRRAIFIIQILINMVQRQPERTDQIVEFLLNTFVDVDGVSPKQAVPNRILQEILKCLAPIYPSILNSGLRSKVDRFIQEAAHNDIIRTSRIGRDVLRDIYPTVNPRGHVCKYVDDGGNHVLEATAYEEVAYNNYFTKGVFDPKNPIFSSLVSGRGVTVILDEGIHDLYHQKIRDYLDANGIGGYTLYRGSGSELHKNIESVFEIIDNAIVDERDRKAVFVAVGGGAMMDVVGLAAQLYRRKVDYIRIPSTLLGLIDAAIGVKCGVNYFYHKNLLGAFYAPYAIISDTSFLKSLGSRQLRSGVGEMLKMAIVSEKKLFEDLEQYGNRIIANELFDERERIIRSAAEGELRHIQRDFIERDLRREVDFGHTFAHYIEEATEYSLLHGEAVVIDILMTSHMAMQRRILDECIFQKIANLVKQLGFPLYHESLTFDKMWQAVRRARAHKGGKLIMVIPEGIGKVGFTNQISKRELKSALSFMKNYAKNKG